MSWYRIHYVHQKCNVAWTCQWSCACNDRCPVCDGEIEPEDYLELTVIIVLDKNAEEWVVSISHPDAEDSPCYRQTRFKTKLAAEAFVASSAYA